MFRSRIVWSFIALFFGSGLGAVGGSWLSYYFPIPASSGSLSPLPHQIPPTAESPAFRFAMAHDVLHERFPRHGKAFYEARETRAREKLKSLPPDSDESFALYDDIAAGQDRLGKPTEAVSTMREKRSLQKRKGVTGQAGYTTSANLGTFLIHANMAQSLSGDPTARAAVEEGLKLLKEAIQINPNSHFGREKWQIAIVEFLIAVGDRPELLKQFDCLGNRLDTELPTYAFNRIARYESEKKYARPFRSHYLQYPWHEVSSRFTEDRDDPTTLDQPLNRDYYWEDSPRDENKVRLHTRRDAYRFFITRIGAETGWEKVSVSTHRKPVAFDEPMLGIIGMWRQGGGANPHFALAIAETMLRVGQREISWSGYERAKRLADRYSKDAETQQFLRDHCTRRQAYIERTFRPGECDSWRNRFDSELAFGEGYQQQMQTQEAKLLSSGVDVYDPKAFEEVHKGLPPIATVPGDEEFALTGNVFTTDLTWSASLIVSFALLGAGLTALLLTVSFRRPRNQSATPGQT